MGQNIAEIQKDFARSIFCLLHIPDEQLRGGNLAAIVILCHICCGAVTPKMFVPDVGRRLHTFL